MLTPDSGKCRVLILRAALSSADIEEWYKLVFLGAEKEKNGKYLIMGERASMFWCEPCLVGSSYFGEKQWTMVDWDKTPEIQEEEEYELRY